MGGRWCGRGDLQPRSWCRLGSPEGRIQQVESVDGAVTYVLSAEGLAEGESIDPASVRTTLGGVDAPTTAAPSPRTPGRSWRAPP